MGRYARSFKDFIDVDDMVKSFHRVANPEKNKSRKSSIVHSPIDWTKYPRSSFQNSTGRCTSINEADDEDEDEDSTESEEDDDIDNGVTTRNNLHMISSDDHFSRSPIDHSNNRRREYNSRRISSTTEPSTNGQMSVKAEEPIKCGRNVSTLSTRRRTSSYTLQHDEVFEPRSTSRNSSTTSHISDDEYNPNQVTVQVHNQHLLHDKATSDITSRIRKTSLNVDYSSDRSSFTRTRKTSVNGTRDTRSRCYSPSMFPVINESGADPGPSTGYGSRGCQCANGEPFIRACCLQKK